MLKSAALLLLVFVFQSAAGEKIAFEFSLDTDEIQVSHWVEGDVVSIPEGIVPFAEGLPALQGIPCHFLLPQGTSINGVTVDVHSRVILSGKYDIAPVNCHILSEPCSPADRSPVYTSPAPFPAAPVTSIESGTRTGFRMGNFSLVPFSYNPLSGELSVITSATVTVECSGSIPGASLTERQISTAAAAIEGIVRNPSSLPEYAPNARSGRDSDPVWVAIGEADIETVLQPLVDHRAVHTGPSEFVSVEWIKNNYSGYDTQEQIRNYLKDQFYNHSLIYALMVGDYGETTRISHLSTGSTLLDNVTDHYYMDLDGTWDLDGDHLYGEAEDGITYYSDLYVGRFSSDNPSHIHNMVEKTISYETQAPAGSWRTTAILIGAGLWPPDYWGSFVCENIDYYIPSDWTVSKLYETMSSHPDNQIDLINNGSSYVSPQGHGWYGGISWYDHAPLDIVSIMNYVHLNNIDMLPVFHSMACQSGEITSSGCLAERLMFSPMGGAIAVMFNSSYGWGTPPTTGPSEWLELYFAKQLFLHQVHEIGVAQAAAKDELQGLSGVPLIGWVTQENNLLGDPALTFIAGQTGIGNTPEEFLPRPVPCSISPNPSTGNCSISFVVPSSGAVSLTVYDVSGRAVRNIYSGLLPEGGRNLAFDGNDNAGNPLPQGCYSVVLSSMSGMTAAMMVVAR